MTDAFKIPLAIGTPQRFSVALSGKDYRLTLKHWDTAEGGWVLDITDATGAPILEGVPLVTGVDLLAQHKHLGFGGELRVQTVTNPDAVPTFENLGDDAVLYWVPE